MIFYRPSFNYDAFGESSKSYAINNNVSVCAGKAPHTLVLLFLLLYLS